MATTTRRRPPPANGIDGSPRTATSPEPRLGQEAQELQRFGTLRQLPIALSAEARTESCQLLNEILADTTILYALYKKAHWNAAGPTFYQLHLLFDKHASEQLELVDAIAERVQMLGGISVGDPRHAAELTTIERAPDGAEEIPVVLDRLLDAHETIIEKVRDGDRQDRGVQGHGHQRPADGRGPPPPRDAGLVHRRARGGRPARRGVARPELADRRLRSWGD